MLSLFSTSSDTAGFRLQYMEVFNWGTFDNKIFKINPQGNNSLLTGSNASGKSTYIDALLTLLVPAKKDRFYNQSSGVDKKGDRTEESYVLGHYGNIQREGEYSTSTQALRDKNTYSVILASFSNTDLRHLTLFQIRWFTNGELKKVFGIAHIPLDINKDFKEFDSKGVWKKRLEKIYNANSNKRKIEFLDGPTAYANRITHLFGMRSSKALSLFNQVVGVKVLDDLDQFIRLNMLEQQDAEAEFIQLKESFLTLMDAKTNIEKAKEQIKQLIPINAIANKLNEIKLELTELNHTKDLAVFWFAKRHIELANQELLKTNSILTELNTQLEELRNKETTLKQQERTLAIAIEQDDVGRQINDLDKEIKQLEQNRDIRKAKLDEYNQAIQKIPLNSNPNEDTFNHNRDKIQEIKNTTQAQIYANKENLFLLKDKEHKYETEIQELVATIQTLQKNKNNIAGRETEIRDEILNHIGANKEEIPFIGELIKVKDDELDWELAIEKILHNFALRLIVPQKYYAKVNQYVNSHNLKGRIRYDKFEPQEYLKNLQTKSLSKNSLLNKIELKSANQYYDWLEEYLSKQFDFACVENLAEFEQYTQMAVTQNGLIKFNRGKHEKDDRPHVSKKENYVLGWDNKEKIELLIKELNTLQVNQKANITAISTSKSQIKELEIYNDECFKLLAKYEKYDDINWQSYALIIQTKTEQKSALEKTNNRVMELQRQLETIQKDLNQLSNTEIDNKKKSIWNQGEIIKKIESDVKQNHNILSSMQADVDVTKFIQTYPDLLHLSYAQLAANKESFAKTTDIKIAELNKQKTNNEDSVKIKINNFKNPEPTITEKFRDWRSDVNNLPDSTALDLIGEYQKMLQKLEKDNLPRFESQWNELLQTTITDKIGSFRIFFTDWEKSIKDNINHLNASLKGIDFKSNPSIYIQLVAVNKKNNDVAEFRKILDKAIPNIRELDTSIDARKNHFIEHIEPLIAQLDHEDWRKKVMDVRAWFSYKAEEFFRENQQKCKTYENMGQLSGGEKAQLTYTILGAAIAYQFGLTKDGLQSDSFRFIAIDEAFKAQDEDKARYLLTLCKQLHLQLLVVTPSDNIHIVENDISFVHYVERKDEKTSWLYDMPIEQFKEQQTNFINQ